MPNRPVPDPQAMAALAVRSGPRSGEEIAVRRSPMKIGRGGQNDVVLDDDSVSTVHARLDHDAGNWRITDLKSTNGTYVDGVQLAPEVPTPLHLGAEVRLGAVQLHFQPLEGPAVEEPEPVRPPPKEAPAARSGGFRLPVWVVVLILVLIALAVFLYGWVLTPDPEPAPAVVAAAAVLPLLPASRASR